ncbi:MAG: cation:proton antiporter [Thermoleophilia bacterium]|nr:cation:proton antiporter [Gaiellaceae bacterium]MDW8338455.1 cation:proton antiporter [Thermoleophilia bacterium]
MDAIEVAAVLVAVALLASIVSVELGVTVALVELTLGVVVGNVLELRSQDWLDLLAAFASVVLTFLAGMEVDPGYLRRRMKASTAIGVASFAGPFVVASAVASLALGWSPRAALIAGTALSTTSLAVVYAVLVERGLTETSTGKLLMCATFVTDLLTAVTLSAIFLEPNLWFPLFLAGSLALVLALPTISPWFFGRYGNRVIEPEIKLVFASLLALMVLADLSGGHAVLPAFVLGLVMARHFAEHREEQKRLRVVAFAFLTPFFFVKGGMNVSLGAVVSNLGLLATLFAAKMVPKIAFVYPLARRADRSHAVFGTLLMSTGLTFGTIASLYGLTAGIVDRTQFSLLVSAVVLSAVVPTLIAERWFLPEAPPRARVGRRGAYEQAEELV